MCVCASDHAYLTPAPTQSSGTLLANDASSHPHLSITPSGGRSWANSQSSLHHRRAHSADPDVLLGGGEGQGPTQDEVGSYLQTLEEQLVELKEQTGMEDEAVM